MISGDNLKNLNAPHIFKDILSIVFGFIFFCIFSYLFGNNLFRYSPYFFLIQDNELLISFVVIIISYFFGQIMQLAGELYLLLLKLFIVFISKNGVEKQRWIDYWKGFYLFNFSHYGPTTIKEHKGFSDFDYLICLNHLSILKDEYIREEYRIFLLDLVLGGAFILCFFYFHWSLIIILLIFTFFRYKSQYNSRRSKEDMLRNRQKVMNA